MYNDKPNLWVSDFRIQSGTNAKQNGFSCSDLIPLISSGFVVLAYQQKFSEFNQIVLYLPALWVPIKLKFQNWFRRIYPRERSLAGNRSLYQRGLCPLMWVLKVGLADIQLVGRRRPAPPRAMILADPRLGRHIPWPSGRHFPVDTQYIWIWHNGTIKMGYFALGRQEMYVFPLHIQADSGPTTSRGIRLFRLKAIASVCRIRGRAATYCRQ